MRHILLLHGVMKGNGSLQLRKTGRHGLVMGYSVHIKDNAPSQYPNYIVLCISLMYMKITFQDKNKIL